MTAAPWHGEALLWQGRSLLQPLNVGGLHAQRTGRDPHSKQPAMRNPPVHQWWLFGSMAAAPLMTKGCKHGGHLAHCGVFRFVSPMGCSNYRHVRNPPPIFELGTNVNGSYPLLLHLRYFSCRPVPPRHFVTILGWGVHGMCLWQCTGTQRL